MKTLCMTISIWFVVISSAQANSVKYLCINEINQFPIQFNKKNKTIITGNGNPKKYWTESDYDFWQTASDYTLYEYTFKKSLNKLSGSLRVKSHHLVTSENKWYDYKCSVSQ